MTSLRDVILREFTPRFHRLMVAADPDGLLLDAELIETLADMGYELIPFEDPIEFRFQYEHRYRSLWDTDLGDEVSMILRKGSSEIDDLPFDLLQSGHTLSFNLGDFFPKLNYKVLREIDPAHLDMLYQIRQAQPPTNLGENATKCYILKHVFDIIPELIKEPADLLNILLRRHYGGWQIPTILDIYQIEILSRNQIFKEWPLDDIIPSREAFFAFVQERWPAFLDRIVDRQVFKTRESTGSYGLNFSGPAELPLEGKDIHVYLDDCFIEGFLQPIAYDRLNDVKLDWVKAGIITTEEADRAQRTESLISRAGVENPQDDACYSDWISYALLWAKLLEHYYELNADKQVMYQDRLQEIRCKIDVSFAAWLEIHYSSLVNLPPSKPIMLHHIPRYLARQLNKGDASKLAFVLVDGLSMDQWLLLERILKKEEDGLRFKTSTLFAWIPTLTSVSRQAAFSGKPPIYFPDSIHTTDREERLWKNFWETQGFEPDHVMYIRGLGDGSIDPVIESISQPNLRVAGLIIDKVDKIMHGMELGSAGMHNQIGQWVNQGYLNELFSALFDHDFLVYLSSDHGNIEAIGCGSPGEASIADLRGARVRVYPDASLREGVKSKFPEALEWPNIWLPEGYLPLIAPQRQAFVRESNRIVTHGGISMEEVIVPFVQISRGSYETA